ncbi:hypothetical protein ACP46_gp50 [Rhizobium phage RHEph06]|uniref:Uncharacterized protein n=4 Tax=Kleczkowskavirus RHEph4 TaxID=1921526 RepID=A0A7S5USK3_9CAUD|nr:hypothetical protein ACP46_gp50 [Rhizobium phage RHEph06]YP_009598491.1 hypothetical protein FDH25_gp49 [Rhizobium phage RHEph04]AGC35811.1 hypothetical protein RHEph05_gp044 [Rhizobium phage RHEph05]QIG67674.1 hypothetical protein EVB51_057 [Rhizobium phage RHph_Y17]QIG68993.1 hypothetical protein EVB73_057 [Rhizobium phage RHph_Y3_43]QIG69542.1 hypothetical protein EVB80_059 [Rhizobium phage RHph_I36]QIG75416.1 hypothetical protein EVC17_059 [Rhizobium phage RHph_Y1_1]QIG75966.1 hypothe
MAKTIYPQSYAFTTLTVGELVKLLDGLDDRMPVVFKSPQYGAFGSGTMYSVDKAEIVKFERKEQHYPASSGVDEEGDPFSNEAYTQVWEEWEGVVIE